MGVGKGGLLSVRESGVCWLSSGWTVWGEEEGGTTVSKRRGVCFGV